MPRPGRAMMSEFLRFVAVGLINTAASYSVYLLLRNPLGVQSAYATAYAVGIATAYWLNSRFVFKTPTSAGGALSYPLVYLAQYLLGAGLLFAFTTWGHLDSRWAALVALVCSTPLSFVLN